MAKITDKQVRALAPRDGRYDKGLGDGLYIRVYPDGRKVARFRYRLGGQTRILTLGEYGRGLGQSTLADLLRAHKAADGALKAGKDPALERDQTREATILARAEHEARVTLETVCTKFKTGYTGRRGQAAPRTLAEYHRHIDAEIVPRWGKFPVEALPVEAMMARMGTMPPVAANRLFATLNLMMNWAVKQRHITSNPLAGMDRPGGHETPKDRALDYNAETEIVSDKGEIRAFWKATESMPEIIRDALRMILLSGQRPSEVLSMRRSHLHAETWRIPAALTKSKKRVHVIPITQTMQEIIDSKPDGDLLFPDSSGDKPLAHARLSRALKESRANQDSPLHGIAGFSPHDLRRTAATHLGALGYLDAEIGILLNHSSAGVTKIYNRGDASTRLRPMLEAWRRRLDRILTGATADVVRLTTNKRN